MTSKYLSGRFSVHVRRWLLRPVLVLAYVAIRLGVSPDLVAQAIRVCCMRVRVESVS